MNRNIKKTMICVFLSFLFSPLFTDHDIRSFDFLQHSAWTVDDGLPLNTVNTILQTADGYLWLGTGAGLVRFDGMKFDIFNHETVPQLSSNVIISLVEDPGGTLWITTRGDGVLRYRDGVFDSITEKDGLLSNDVWAIQVSVDGSIWLGTRRGLNRMAKGSLSAVPMPGNLPTHEVSALLEDRNGRIWVGTHGGGLFRFGGRGNSNEPDYSGLEGKIITALFEDRQGSLWAGTMEHGLFKYQGGRWSSYTVKEGLASNNIFCFYEDRRGNLWIGSQGGGICIHTADDDRITPFRGQGDFKSNMVLDFCEDREGTLWIATNGHGLNCLRQTKMITYTPKNGLSYDNTYGVFQDSEGRIWSGTKGYGVNVFKDNRFQNMTTREGLPVNSVVSFAQQRSGAMWFGTMGGGVCRWKDNRFDTFNTQNGLSYNFSRCVYVDPGDTVWAGTSKGGVHRFDEASGSFTMVGNVKFRINTMLKDSKGNLWLGTFGRGMCRLVDGKIEVFDEKQGLSNNIISCLYEDRDGVIWIGTVKGINRFHDGIFSHLYKKNGLPDDVVYCIMEDHNRDFWISSNKGIYCLGRKEAEAFFDGKIRQVEPTVYSREAGMLSPECNGGNHPAGWKSGDGKLWFPTTRGLAVIDPRNIGLNKIPPPLVVEQIVSDCTPLPTEESVTVPPDCNNLVIHFTALSFVVPDKIRFKCKLEGYEDDWRDNGNKRSIQYTAIPPGKYRFRVIARNSDGIWNTTGAAFDVYLKPRLYQTTAFQLGLLAGFFSLGLLSYFYLKKNLVIRRARQKTRCLPINPEETSQHIQKLRYLLEVEKVYKESDLTIKSLASRLLLTPRCLSQLINDHLNTNFYEFVNDYRIKAAQKMLKEPKSRSILDIAHEVGYNSKSAFNRAFKNFTQMTPSQYRKSGRRDH